MKQGKNGKAKHLYNVLKYIENPQKTQNRALVDYVNCMSDYAYEDMIRTKQRHDAEDGRQGYHVIISFKPGETDPETAHKIAGEFVSKFLKDEYEAVYATHDDMEHIHSHIVFNSVSWRTGKKYHYSNGDWEKILQPITNELSEKYGLSIMVNTRGNNTPYNMWKAEKDGKTTWREVIKKDIDSLVSDAGTIGGLIIALEEIGYQVKYNPYSKSIAFKPYGAKRYIRTSSLGEGYSVKDIESKLYGGYIKEISSIIRRNRKPLRRYQKKLKLSKFEAYYYRYMYMLGKIKHKKRFRVNPKDRLKIDRLQKRVAYLHENNICTINDLSERMEIIKEQKSGLVTRRVNIYRARKKYKDAFDLLAKYMVLKDDETLYLAGDEFFKKNYIKRQEIKKEIESMSKMSIEDVIAKKEYFDLGLSEVREKLRELGKEEKICKDIEEDYKSQKGKEKEQEKTWDKKKNKVFK